MLSFLGGAGEGQILMCGKDVEKLGHLCTGDRKVKQCSHYANQYDGSRRKIQLLYGPAIPLLGIRPKELPSGS